MKSLFGWMLVVSSLVVWSCSSGDAGADADVIDAKGTVDVQDETPMTCTEGDDCDDLDPCTIHDRCLDGVCAGEAVSCPVYACGVAVCSPEDGGCRVEEIQDGFCLIEDLCVEAGAISPSNSCRSCQPELDPRDYSVRPDASSCEDGNVCTENDACSGGVCEPGSPPTCADGFLCTVDRCDPELGCVHEPDHSFCEDSNPCTKNLCSPASGCVFEPDDSLICSDDDLCTVGDRCENGLCVSGVTTDCDDGNVCTDEFCHPLYGCIFTFNNNPCSDGAMCTMVDACYFGKCVGEDPWGDCPSCEINFGPHVVKVNSLRLGEGGYPGEALNIDGDLKTCSPPGQCELGLDNIMSFAGELINDMLLENLADKNNPMVILVHLKDPTLDGSSFQMNLLYGGLSLSDIGCALMTEECIYRVGYINFDPLCNAQISFPNTTITDGVLRAGGSGYIFPYTMGFEGGGVAETVLYNAKVEGDIETDDNGRVTRVNGVLGGAVTPADLSGLISAIPAQYFPGGSKQMVLSLLAGLPPDIDLNGDGTADALSINFVIDTIPGVIEAFKN